MTQASRDEAAQHRPSRNGTGGACATDDLATLLTAAAVRPSDCYLRPCGLLDGISQCADPSYALAGGRFLFTQAELILRRPEGRIGSDRLIAPMDRVRAGAAQAGRALSHRLEALLTGLTAARPPFAGVSLDRPRIMGVVNVTPDSFSDGGRFFGAAEAVAQARRLVGEGADFLDVGGESTRPGSEAIPALEQLRRIGPVLDDWQTAGGHGVPLSVDTRDAEVMAAALDRGAAIVNDISALTDDPGSLPLVAARQVPVILMHIQGTPATMQTAPRYVDAALDIFDFLEARIEACQTAGLGLGQIAVDPGIGFGKTVAHNLDLLRDAALFHGLGCVVLYGVSRKRFIGRLSRDEPAPERVPGTVSAVVGLWSQGIQLLRVHDVAAAAQARAVWEGVHPAPAARVWSEEA